MKSSRTLPRLISTLITLLIIFLLFWFQLPPLHWRSPAFWTFVIECLVVVIVCFSLAEIAAKIKDFGTNMNNGKIDFSAFRIQKGQKGKRPWQLYIAGTIVVLVVATMIGGLVGAEIFNAARYRDLITIEDGDFSEDIAQLSMDQIPVVDRDTAMRLGQRQLGTIPDLVSQFEISVDYTQINVEEKPTRVTPLTYADFFKWLGNRQEGIPGYIVVDMVTQNTELVRLPEGEGIMYSESEYFLRNIDRYLRFTYPTQIFSEVLFEIDDEGNPYWVAPCMEYRIGLWSGIDVKGAVLVKADTGESQYYTVGDIPQWVDRVYDSNNIIDQLNWNGKYQEGFINAYFGQRNVRCATDGYNYIAVDDDVYLYTGMTSATADESNIGFVLVNMRTKETKFYTVPGAEEYSAMASAEGQVQHLGYSATFPILLNVADRPTYFMSLKDASGLVKMYAYVDVQRYQVVGTGDTVEAAQSDYISKLQSDDEVEITQEATAFTAVITDIGSAVVDGSTRYYFRFDGQSGVYTADIKLSEELPFLEIGDEITVEYSKLTDEQTLFEIGTLTVA